jgi:hypothetical protein
MLHFFYLPKKKRFCVSIVKFLNMHQFKYEKILQIFLSPTATKIFGCNPDTNLDPLSGFAGPDLKYSRIQSTGFLCSISVFFLLPVSMV